MTVEQYVQRWLDSTVATPVADRERYRPHLERYILPRLERCHLADVIPSDIRLLLNQVIRSATADPDDEVYRTCGLLLDAALADGLLDRSPVTPRRGPSAPATRSVE